MFVITFLHQTLLIRKSETVKTILTLFYPQFKQLTKTQSKKIDRCHCIGYFGAPSVIHCNVKNNLNKCLSDR